MTESTSTELATKAQELSRGYEFTSWAVRAQNTLSVVEMKNVDDIVYSLIPEVLEFCPCAKVRYGHSVDGGLKYIVSGHHGELVRERLVDMLNIICSEISHEVAMYSRAEIPPSCYSQPATAEEM